MTSPFAPVESLSDAEYAVLRRRAIFDCHKWDPQVGDANVIARYPLILRRDAWNEIVPLSEALAKETLAAEAELLQRPDLHSRLGLPRQVRRALALAGSLGPPAGAARIVRFDFHYTRDGWRISEANSDVPGGLNEASGFARLMAPHYPTAAPVGDPAQAYAHAIVRATGAGATIALVHATAYSDDLQMMKYVAERLESAGARTHLASPAHVRWQDGRAELNASWGRGPLDLVVRFFPGDWLEKLEGRAGWRAAFAGAVTPLSNPPTALLTQSKRFPLVWHELDTPLPTWTSLLPETRDPRDARWRADDAWVLKPALGRVGEGIAIAGQVEGHDLRKIQRSALWWPGSWIAQRRFDSEPVDLAGRPMHVCLGVYTVDGRVAGAYGRVSERPLVNSSAKDAAVLAA
jgi:glutathionylspermidine synthase